MSKAHLTMKLSKGRPATGGRLREAFEHSQMAQAGSAAFKKIAKAGTPIGATKRLSESWIVREGAHWSGYTYGETVTNNASSRGYLYATRVNRVSRRNAGYIGRIMSQANQEVGRAMAERKAELVDKLWVKG